MSERDMIHVFDPTVAGDGAPQVFLEPGSGAATSLTVEAQVDCPAPRAEAMQVIAGRWAFADEMTAFATYDAGQTGDLDTAGYFGEIGRAHV